MWRPMTPEDIPHVYRISLCIHSLYEDPEIFQERMSLSPGSFVLIDPDIVGYLISHPYRRDTHPPLNTLIREIPKDADTWYIHDLAILPEFRGRGMVRPVLDMVRELALRHGNKECSLVSIYGREKFWKKMGFRLAPGYGTRMKQSLQDEHVKIEPGKIGM